MLRSDLEKPVEEFFRIRSSLDGEKINYLNKEFCLTVAGFADGFDQLLQPGKKSIMADAQQGPAGNIAHAGSFNHNCAGSTGSKAAIPIEIVPGDETIFSG